MKVVHRKSKTAVPVPKANRESLDKALAAHLDARFELEKKQVELERAKDTVAIAEAELIGTLIEMIQRGDLPLQCLKINWRELKQIPDDEDPR